MKTGTPLFFCKLGPALVVGAAFAVGSAGCATMGSGASDCDRLIKTEHSPFGDVRGFVVSVGWGGGYEEVGLAQTTTGYRLEVLLAASGNVRAVVKAGPQEFALGGHVVRFTTQEDTIPVADAGTDTVFTQWKLQFALSRTQAARFAAEHLEGVRIKVGAETRELSLKPNQAERFQTAAACLLPTEGAPAGK